MTTITGSWFGEATAGGATAEIPIDVSWSTGDPLVLSCVFDGVAWDIGRGLIASAYEDAPLLSGQGDVKAYVQNSSLHIVLHTDEGMAQVWMPSWRMWGFVRKTYGIVAEGAESLDLDGTIKKILEWSS